jgi:hypothetical protein
MKHLIKKILKEESLKHSLKDQVKEFGWEKTSELVGDPEVLANLGFNNDPMEFLNLFNDLDVVRSKDHPSIFILLRYEEGKNMFIYDTREDYNIVYPSYFDIWLFLKHGFNLEVFDREDIVKEWLGNTYDIHPNVVDSFDPGGGVII